MTKRTLEQTLAESTKTGELWKTLPDGRIECFACGHRCPIPEGKAGVCRVRFNQGGKLHVPWGYVGALQDDPIEKKPFFHALPGARALSFGMLGCDYHCGYCFTESTKVMTAIGPVSIGDLARQKMKVDVYTHQGRRRRIKNYFARFYEGPLIKIKPAFTPSIESTPEHPFLARLRPDRFPDGEAAFTEAKKLTKDHCLAIPKKYSFSRRVIIDVRKNLESRLSFYQAKRTIPKAVLERVMSLTSQGQSSRQISEIVGKSASHIRHLRSKLQKGIWNLETLGRSKALLRAEGKTIRFSKEHRPGIPGRVPLDGDFAELLGHYCAEGSVVKALGRVHAATLNFSFSKREIDKVTRVKALIRKLFGVKGYFVSRPTTFVLATAKTSLVTLFQSLCGAGAAAKRVPEALFYSEAAVIKRFLDAYVAGDGYRAPDGHVRISTVSKDLASGVYWLVQKMGYLAQYYEYPNAGRRKLLGRNIKQAPRTYHVRWYENGKKQRHVWEDARYRYVLVEKIEKRYFSGEVFNLEVDKDQSYLAEGLAVHNCQNWVTSQALRDPKAVSPMIPMTPEKLIRIAKERECEVVVSTYNEPLITSEWAVEIFKIAKREGLVTAYVSNGNGTPEVLDYIKPWVDLYKIDLKGFDDKHYRELGGVLENVKRTIKDVHERKFWLEIVTLLIPGFNDSNEEITKLTEFVASVSPDIPWHCTAFHPDYKMQDRDFTPAKTLLRAVEIGRKAGLKFIYPGNIPGQVGDGENTKCPQCGETLIKRFGFEVIEDELSKTGGKCQKCQTQIPGFWKKRTNANPSDGHIRPVF